MGINKQKQDKGYYIIVPEKKSDDWSLSAISISFDGTIIEDIYFEKLNLNESISFLDEWGKTLENWRVISDNQEVYFQFLNDIKPHLSIFSYRMFKAKLWNIYNEMIYYLKLPRNMNIDEILFLYGFDYPKHSSPIRNKTIQLYYLTQLYLFDRKQTNKLMKNNIYQLLKEKFEKEPVDNLIYYLHKLDFKISIEKETLPNFTLRAYSDTFQTSINSSSLQQGLASMCAEIQSFLIKNPRKISCEKGQS